MAESGISPLTARTAELSRPPYRSQGKDQPQANQPSKQQWLMQPATRDLEERNGSWEPGIQQKQRQTATKGEGPPLRVIAVRHTGNPDIPLKLYSRFLLRHRFSSNQTCRFLGKISDNEVRPGPPNRRKRLKHGSLRLQPAPRERRLQHAVLS